MDTQANTDRNLTSVTAIGVGKYSTEEMQNLQRNLTVVCVLS